MLIFAADASDYVAIFEIARSKIHKHRCARIVENNTH